MATPKATPSWMADSSFAPSPVYLPFLPWFVWMNEWMNKWMNALSWISSARLREGKKRKTTLFIDFCIDLFHFRFGITFIRFQSRGAFSSYVFWVRMTVFTSTLHCMIRCVVSMHCEIRLHIAAAQCLYATIILIWKFSCSVLRHDGGVDVLHDLLWTRHFLRSGRYRPHWSRPN